MIMPSTIAGEGEDARFGHARRVRCPRGHLPRATRPPLPSRRRWWTGRSRQVSSWAPDPSSVPEAGVFAFAGDCARHDHPVDSRSGRAASRHRPTVVLSRTRLTLHAVPQRVLELLRLTDLQAVFGVIDESATISNTADVALGLGAPDGDHLLAQGAALSAEGSLELLELEEQVAGRRATASGRSRIDQARGLVMATRGCDAETAWRVLFLASREQDVQVHD